ncbi:MAG: hypothetical protein ACLU99_03525 [Alphaproteobacteria bacterium]
MRRIGLGLTVGYDGISRLAFLKLRTPTFCRTLKSRLRKLPVTFDG